MAASMNDSEEMITGINVTPLVDVVLVLLIIFMITAPVIYQATIKVELPKAKSGEKTEQVTLRFAIQKDGTLALGNQAVPRTAIPEIVKKALEKDPNANAVVAADEGLTHGSVIQFIDLLKTNGITRFAIGVESAERK